MTITILFCAVINSSRHKLSLFLCCEWWATTKTVQNTRFTLNSQPVYTLFCHKQRIMNRTWIHSTTIWNDLFVSHSLPADLSKNKIKLKVSQSFVVLLKIYADRRMPNIFVACRVFIYLFFIVRRIGVDVSERKRCRKRDLFIFLRKIIYPITNWW